MSLRSASFTNLHLPGESTVKVAISTPPRGGKIVVTPTTGFELGSLTLTQPLPRPLTPTPTLTRYELETEFTLTAPNWNGGVQPRLLLPCTYHLLPVYSLPTHYLHTMHYLLPLDSLQTATYTTLTWRRAPKTV